MKALFTPTIFFVLTVLIGTEASAFKERSKIQNKIFRGSFAQIGEFPYNCWLLAFGGSLNSCGCSIVTSQWVVTAAHCVEGKQMRFMTVYAGCTDRTSTENRQEAEVLQIVYNGYESSTRNNNIALLQLDKQLTFNNYVQKIRIPQIPDTIPENSDCYVTGWGQTGGGATTLNLKYGNVDVISNDKCDSWLSSGVALTNSTFCSGSNETDTSPCEGDDGGPLVCHDDVTKTSYLYGVVSWLDTSGSCGSNPTVYTKTSDYYDWIENTTSLAYEGCDDVYNCTCDDDVSISFSGCEISTTETSVTDTTISSITNETTVSSSTNSPVLTSTPNLDTASTASISTTSTADNVSLSETTVLSTTSTSNLFETTRPTNDTASIETTLNVTVSTNTTVSLENNSNSTRSFINIWYIIGPSIGVVVLVSVGVVCVMRTYNSSTSKA